MPRKKKPMPRRRPPKSAAPLTRRPSRLHQTWAADPAPLDLVDVELNILGNPTVVKLDPRQFAPAVAETLKSFERRLNSVLLSIERRVAHLEALRSAGPQRNDISDVLQQLRERLS